MLLTTIVTDEPLVFGIDETIERRRGAKITDWMSRGLVNCGAGCRIGREWTSVTAVTRHWNSCIAVRP